MVNKFSVFLALSVFPVFAYAQDKAATTHAVDNQAALQQVQVLLANAESKKYLESVSPNLRYIVEAAQHMLPSLDETKVATEQLVNILLQQIVWMGVANLVYWLFVLLAYMIVTRASWKLVNDPRTWDVGRHELPMLGITSFLGLVVGTIGSLVILYKLHEPLQQIFSPAGWLLLQVAGN